MGEEEEQHEKLAADGMGEMAQAAWSHTPVTWGIMDPRRALAAGGRS